MRPTIPSEILAMGHARSAARRARNFREADRLRVAIEAAGYRVVDRGGDFMLAPAHPVDLEETDGRIRYGWSGAVPTRLDGPASCAATLVIVAGGGVEPLRRTLEGLRAHAPAGTQVVMVAPPDPDLDAALTPRDLLAPIAGAPPEVVLTAVRLRPAAARNAGARRAAGSIVAWLQPGATVTGDVVTPLIAALEDPAVAVAGAVGLTATDIRHLAPAPAGDVDAVDRTLLAFRREDITALGALDEHFHGDEQLDRWWSLVLRDGPDEPDAEPVATGAAGTDPADEEQDQSTADDEQDGYVARRAVSLDLPIDPATAVALPGDPVDGAEDARRRKRDLYRLIDRFTGRPDLLRPPASGR